VRYALRMHAVPVVLLPIRSQPLAHVHAHASPTAPCPQLTDTSHLVAGYICVADVLARAPGTSPAAATSSCPHAATHCPLSVTYLSTHHVNLVTAGVPARTRQGPCQQPLHQHPEHHSSAHQHLLSLLNSSTHLDATPLPQVSPRARAKDLASSCYISILNIILRLLDTTCHSSTH
jgi:hypothetical protein